jgi:acetyltransferase-like isoleucine patch superfamily enzyme
VYIGSAVSVKENIHIGEQSLLGIGANVVTNVDVKTVVVGNPAKPMRKNI